MSAIGVIQNRFKTIVGIVIGITLLAFIAGGLFEGGSSIVRDSQSQVGEINGVSVSVTEYKDAISNITSIYELTSGTRTTDEAMSNRLREEAWNSIVREAVMTPVYENVGIEVSEDEMTDLVVGDNIHPLVARLFTDPSTGQVNKSAIINYLKSTTMNVDQSGTAVWNSVLDLVEQDRKLAKYMGMVNLGLYATDIEAKNEMESKGATFSFDYVSVPLSSVKNEDVTVTENQIKDYYDANFETFKRKATKTIKYVVFPIQAEQRDDDEAKEWTSDLVSGFKTTENVQGYVNSNSSVPFTDRFVKRDELSPEVAEFAFAAEKGDVKAPYKEGDSWRITKLVDVKEIPDSVKTRHILIPVQSAPEYQAAKAMADSLKGLLDAGKAKFATLAEEHSKDQASAVKGGDLGWVKRGVMVAQFEDAAFSASKNSISIVETQFGVHLLEVTAQSAKSKNVKVATIVRDITAGAETEDIVYKSAIKCALAAKDGDFDGAVEESGIVARSASVTDQDASISNLKNSRVIIRDAFNNGVKGQLISNYGGDILYSTESSYVVAYLADESAEGYLSVDAARSIIELEVIKDSKRAYLAEKVKGSVLASIATANGVEVKHADNQSFGMFMPSGMGLDAAVIGAASGAEEGVCVSPIIGENAVSALILKSKVAAPADGDIEASRQMATQMYQRLIGGSVYPSIIDPMEIVDSRVRFY